MTHCTGRSCSDLRCAAPPITRSFLSPTFISHFSFPTPSALCSHAPLPLRCLHRPPSRAARVSMALAAPMLCAAVFVPSAVCCLSPVATLCSLRVTRDSHTPHSHSVHSLFAPPLLSFRLSPSSASLRFRQPISPSPPSPRSLFVSSSHSFEANVRAPPRSCPTARLLTTQRCAERSGALRRWFAVVLSSAAHQPYSSITLTPLPPPLHLHLHLTSLHLHVHHALSFLRFRFGSFRFRLFRATNRGGRSGGVVCCANRRRNHRAL